MTLGDIIKQYREEHELNMEQFAEKAGLSKGYVSMLEKNEHPKTGKPISPSLEKIKDIAGAMDLTIDDILKIIDSEQNIVIGSLGTGKTTLLKKSVAYTPTTKEEVLKNLIENSKLPDEKLDVLINMIKSWK